MRGIAGLTATGALVAVLSAAVSQAVERLPATALMAFGINVIALLRCALLHELGLLTQRLGAELAADELIVGREGLDAMLGDPERLIAIGATLVHADKGRHFHDRSWDKVNVATKCSVSRA